MITLILVILALVLFLLAGLGAPAGRFSLGWFGLAALCVAYLVQHASA